MTDFMDTILSSFNEDVKQNNNKVLQTVQPDKEIPTYLNDPTIQHQSIIIPEKKNYRPQLSEYAKTEYTFKSLINKGEENKLTDSFRNKEIEKTQTRTERSFTQTLASYTKYISILQATT